VHSEQNIQNILLQKTLLAAPVEGVMEDEERTRRDLKRTAKDRNTASNNFK